MVVGDGWCGSVDLNVLTDGDVNRRANFDSREHNGDVELWVGSLGDLVLDVWLDSAATCAKTCVWV